MALARDVSIVGSVRLVQGILGHRPRGKVGVADHAHPPRPRRRWGLVSAENLRLLGQPGPVGPISQRPGHRFPTAVQAQHAPWLRQRRTAAVAR